MRQRISTISTLAYSFLIMWNVMKTDIWKFKIYNRSNYKKRWIYYLLQWKKIVYIGQSEHVFSRICNHDVHGKIFDWIWYIEIDWPLSKKEESEIRKWKPIYNKNQYPWKNTKLTLILSMLRRSWFNVPNVNNNIKQITPAKQKRYIEGLTWIPYRKIDWLFRTRNSDIKKMIIKFYP